MWRDASGRLGVARAWCPHLGAHLGHVGRVKGDVLECGFHGFCFDAAGQCRATGYGGRVPSRARLSSFAVSHQVPPTPPLASRRGRSYRAVPALGGPVLESLNGTSGN